MCCVLQVLSAAVFTTQDTALLADLMQEHLREVRTRVPTVAHATFVLNVESNLAYVAESLDAQFKKPERRARLPRMEVIHADPRRAAAGGGGATDLARAFTAGTRTTERNKKEMVSVFRSLLQGALVAFARQYWTPDEQRENRGQMVSELAAFQRVFEFVKNHDGVVRERFTGKGRGSTRQDDWVMALLITSFTIDRVMRDSAFAHLRVGG